ncbi:MAG: MBL fold metallo-hydrolase [Gemmatimonadales bacterium]
MIEDVAPGLLRLSFGPVADGVNMYLMGDVLVDSGVSWTAAKLQRTLEGRSVASHAITHAHFDHSGASHVIAEVLGIPVWCGEGDRAALESGDPATVLPNPRGALLRFARLLAAPAHPVARTLREGDELAGFTVIEAPFKRVIKAIDRVAVVRRLLVNGWIRMMIIDPESGITHLYDEGEWQEITVPAKSGTVTDQEAIAI